MRQPSKHPSNTGFTLIEVLITLVIFSIGLLGLAGLQANSMINNHNAYLKSQATLMANDMAERMRANIEGVSDNEYDNINGIPQDPDCIAVGCTPAQMADYDAFEWNTTLAQELPSGAGTVVGNGVDFTITVRWDERRNSAAGPANVAPDGTDCDPANTADLKCIILSVTLL